MAVHCRLYETFRTNKKRTHSEGSHSLCCGLLIMVIFLLFNEISHFFRELRILVRVLKRNSFISLYKFMET